MAARSRLQSVGSRIQVLPEVLGIHITINIHLANMNKLALSNHNYSNTLTEKSTSSLSTTILAGRLGGSSFVNGSRRDRDVFCTAGAGSIEGDSTVIGVIVVRAVTKLSAVVDWVDCES